MGGRGGNALARDPMVCSSCVGSSAALGGCDRVGDGGGVWRGDRLQWRLDGEPWRGSGLQRRLRGGLALWRSNLYVDLLRVGVYE
jgi:hypothetical protein